jgi:hypothetical protein
LYIKFLKVFRIKIKFQYGIYRNIGFQKFKYAFLRISIHVVNDGYINFNISRPSFLCKVNFFPPNFSFVFWTREIWREKITWKKSAKKVFPFCERNPDGTHENFDDIIFCTHKVPSKNQHVKLIQRKSSILNFRFIFP